MRGVVSPGNRQGPDPGPLYMGVFFWTSLQINPPIQGEHLSRFDEFKEELINSPLPLNEKLDFHMRLIMGKNFSPVWRDVADNLLLAARIGKALDTPLALPPVDSQKFLKTDKPTLGYLIEVFKLDIYLTDAPLNRAVSVSGGRAQVEEGL